MLEAIVCISVVVLSALLALLAFAPVFLLEAEKKEIEKKRKSIQYTIPPFRVDDYDIE